MLYIRKYGSTFNNIIGIAMVILAYLGPMGILYVVIMIIIHCMQ